MAVTGLKAVFQWVMRTMMKSKGETGIVQTMPKRDLVELNTQITAQRLMQNGIDPTQLKNADQVENAIKMIESRPATGGVTSTKSAKIFDMEGKEIPKGSKIMGGKAIDDLPPPGSRGGPDDIAAPVMNVEDAPEGFIDFVRKTDPKGAAKLQKEENRIKAKIEAANKRAAENIRRKKEEGTYKRFQPSPELDRQIKEEYKKAVRGESKQFPGKFRGTEEDFRDMIDELSDDFAQGGRAGFVAGGITNLAMRLARGFMKVTGRKPNDEELMKIIREAAERDFAEVSDDAVLKGVSETRATARRMDSIDKDELKKAIDEYKIPVRTQEQFDFAQGGRAGFSKGKLVDLARRKFLKTAASVGAGIGALKTGLLGLGKEAAPMVEAAKETVTKAPDYFFALVDKIKRFGKSVDDAVADRRLEQTYRYKNYELRENAFGEPGETIITKTDDMGEFGYKEESMRFKKGGQTEDGFVPDEYEELTVRPDREGKLKDVEDGIEDVSEIIEEATKSAPPIKKASGGIARMLGE